MTEHYLLVTFGAFEHPGASQEVKLQQEVPSEMVSRNPNSQPTDQQ